jgi:hypothetical protein
MNKLLGQTDAMLKGYNSNYLKTIPNSNKGVSSIQPLNMSKTLIKNVENKPLSIQTLLETINEIYKSKKIQDNKNNSLKQPYETMEQHLYKYLNNKYGLKQLVIEKAMNIIESLEKYSNENSEVCLFTKMMRNDIDESSIDINNELKKNLKKIIKNNDINDKLINQIIQSLYLNNKNDIELFNKKLLKEKTKTGGEINFNQLHNVILGVHIDDRCKYLSKFKRLFLKYDPENKGIIDKDQCIQLLTTLYNNLKNNNDLLISISFI